MGNPGCQAEEVKATNKFFYAVVDTSRPGTSFFMQSSTPRDPEQVFYVVVDCGRLPRATRPGPRLPAPSAGCYPYLLWMAWSYATNKRGCGQGDTRGAVVREDLDADRARQREKVAVAPL